jgi:hypothetical protein
VLGASRITRAVVSSSLVTTGGGRVSRRARRSCSRSWRFVYVRKLVQNTAREDRAHIPTDPVLVLPASSPLTRPSDRRSVLLNGFLAEVSAPVRRSAACRIEIGASPRQARCQSSAADRLDCLSVFGFEPAYQGVLRASHHLHPVAAGARHGGEPRRMDRIGVIADAHANLPATRAALDALAARQCTTVVH